MAAAGIFHGLCRSNISLYSDRLQLPESGGKGGVTVKRIQSACILQTLAFSQKEDMGLSREQMLKLNHEEIEGYKKRLEKTRTRYQIVDETEQEDGSILLRVRKQYNDKADVSEYFA